MKAGQIGSAEFKDLVTRAATLDLNLAAPSLARLAALWPSVPGQPAAAGVTDEAVWLKASISFRPGPEGHPQLHVTAEGKVPLVCQRCLELLVLPVTIDVVLTAVRSDAEAAGLADPFDTVLLESGGLDLAQVVEDEVLAILPLAARHPETTACGRAARMYSSETNRPLAGLASLLGRDDRQND